MVARDEGQNNLEECQFLMNISDIFLNQIRFRFITFHLSSNYSKVRLRNTYIINYHWRVKISTF